MGMPLISVLMVNYNHGEHIRESIDCVLNQTYKNIQFVIVDDCSTDQSKAIIRSYEDPRIECYLQEKNRHISHATNFGFQKIKGEFLARIDSDDTWELDKLDRQMKFFRLNPDCKVAFTWVNIIDETSHQVNVEHKDLLRIYESHTQTQEEWLRFFFYQGNCLAQPSILMRSELLSEIGEFNLAFRQSHDFDYWVRIAKKYQIYVQEERLLNVRRFSSQERKNTSSLGEEDTTRFYNEYAVIRYTFFDDMEKALFVRTFRSDFRNPEAVSDQELECEKAFLLCDYLHVTMPTPVLGLWKLEALMKNAKYAELLEKQYKFTPIDYYRLSGQHLYYDRYMKEQTDKMEMYYTDVISIRQELERARRALAESKAQLSSVSAALTSLENSTCWRMTKPIRALLDGIKRNH